MNSLRDVSKMIENQDIMRNDFYDAYTSANSIIKDRYISKFQNAIKEHTDYIEKNPCKEIQLLRTMKLFSDTDKHSAIDNMIDIISKYETFRSIEQEFSEISGQYRGSNICSNPIMFFLLSSMMKK